MDKERIKAEALKFIAGCEAAQHKLTFCALIPQMPRYENTTYILQVSATWLETSTPTSSISRSALGPSPTVVT